MAHFPVVFFRVLAAVLGFGSALASGSSFGSPTDKIPAFDVVLTPGDPTCFGNDVDLLLSWWYSDNVWTQGRTYWKWAEGSRFAEMQELIQKARESADPAEQQSLWNQCFDLLSDEVPLYPLFHRQLATGYRPDKIDGFKPIATTGLMFLDAQPK